MAGRRNNERIPDTENVLALRSMRQGLRVQRGRRKVLHGMKRLISWFKRKRLTDGCVFENGKARLTLNSQMRRLLEGE
jgi:hypothetical protein